MLKIVCIIPTYNESGNVQNIIQAVESISAQSQHDLHVLIVDDSSPDGTGAIVKEYMPKWNKLHLLEGAKQGLGVAYTRGMFHALHELDADAVFEMDADFSHDPNDIPRFIAEIENGSDFVIGSRYVPGGSIPSEWGFHRKLNSSLGNLVARYVAGIYSTKDCTSGFRCIKAELLKNINFDRLNAQGYSFQVALLHAAKVAGAKIKEIPIQFTDRSVGESKLGFSDIVEFIFNAWWIRLNSSVTFLKFLLVGASGVVVNLGAFLLLMSFGIDKFIASPIAIQISIITNFILNNNWTFTKRNRSERIAIRGLKFNAVSFLALGISYTTFILVSLSLPTWPPYIAQLIGIIPATLVNYLLNSYWTFKRIEQ